MRCVLEARLHERNSFVTLTYSDDELPDDRSLNRSHLQKFFKRLAKAKGPFRQYSCGEYGETTKRAHYHACLFGIDFDDKQELERRGDNVLYYSEELTRLWGHGHTSVGALTFETAAYTARYVLKKKLGNGDLQHVLLHEETGELIPVAQPFAAMSRGNRLQPHNAIGHNWLKRYGTDIYSADKDFLVIRNQKMKPPAYFDRLFDTIDSERIERIKLKRKEERTPLSLQELRTHERITRARLIKKTKI